MENIKRWYDKIPKLKEIYATLKILDEGQELHQIAYLLYKSANDLKREKINSNHLRSIGAEKLIGHYQAYNKRRWYDNNQYLCSATKLLNTMSKEEIHLIIDDFISALKSHGLDRVFALKRKELIDSIQK